MKTATAIHLAPEVREQLVRFARGRSVSKRLVERAGIVLRAAQGQQSQAIAAEMGLSRPAPRSSTSCLRSPNVKKR